MARASGGGLGSLGRIVTCRQDFPSTFFPTCIKTLFIFRTSNSQFPSKYFHLFHILLLQARDNRCKERGPESSLGSNRGQVSFKLSIIFFFDLKSGSVEAEMF